MITKPAKEKISKILSSSGIVSSSGIEVSAITIYGGTGATGGTVVFDNSSDGSGTVRWEISAVQHGSSSVSFPKPIVFSSGCYATIAGTAVKVSIAYT